MANQGALGPVGTPGAEYMSMPLIATNHPSLPTPYTYNPANAQEVWWRIQIPSAGTIQFDGYLSTLPDGTIVTPGSEPYSQVAYAYELTPASITDLSGGASQKFEVTFSGPQDFWVGGLGLHSLSDYSGVLFVMNVTSTDIIMDDVGGGGGDPPPDPDPPPPTGPLGEPLGYEWLHPKNVRVRDPLEPSTHNAVVGNRNTMWADGSDATYATCNRWIAADDPEPGYLFADLQAVPDAVLPAFDSTTAKIKARVTLPPGESAASPSVSQLGFRVRFYPPGFNGDPESRLPWARLLTSFSHDPHLQNWDTIEYHALNCIVSQFFSSGTDGPADLQTLIRSGSTVVVDKITYSGAGANYFSVDNELVEAAVYELYFNLAVPAPAIAGTDDGVRRIFTC